MTWLLRISQRIGRWMRARREAKERAHAQQIDAARDAVMAIWNHLHGKALIDHETEARFDRAFEVLTMRKRLR